MKHAARRIAVISLLSGVALSLPMLGVGEPTRPSIPASSAPASTPAPTPAPTPATIAKTLKVGDFAPPLAVETWVKGEQVTGFEPGKVYVIEFFATWCVPCVASIPQMTEMQRKHKDLTVICIAGSERAKPGEADQRLSRLRDFVDAQGARIGYRVAFDSTKTMTRTWMLPAGLRGIPCGFVVDGEGRIAHIGHPLDAEFKESYTDALARAKTAPHARNRAADTRTTTPPRTDSRSTQQTLPVAPSRR